MDWKKLVLSAFAFAVISQVIRAAGAIADMPFYTDPAYFSLWSTIMMPGASPPGAEFYAYSIAFALITGAIFAYAYSKTKQAFVVKKSFRSEKYWKVGMRFGLFLFLLTTFTGTLSMCLIFSVPLALQLSWMLQGLAICLLGGVAFAKVMG